MKIVKKKLEDLQVGDLLVDNSGRQYEIEEDYRDDDDSMPFVLDKKINGDNMPEFDDYEYEGIKEGEYFNVLDTTEQEKKIIKIEGVKYEVTKDGDGWSKPVRVERKKGDVVELEVLNAGDKILFPAVINSKHGEFFSICIEGLAVDISCTSKDKAIYNGSTNDEQ